MHQSLLVFDLETIPDLGAAQALTGCTDTDPAAIRAALEAYHLHATDGRNGFPRQPFHQVVAVAVVHATIERDGPHERYQLQTVKAGGEEDYSEQELLQAFLGLFNREAPRLVSFNGRNFDLPVLRFRAMKHGLAWPKLYRAGASKWDNYQSRYSADWHCDLLDVLKDYGAMTGGLKLNEIAALLNLPGKIGVDGSMVTQLADAGELATIRNYCETDVLNTYLVYLHHQHHTGVLQAADFKAEIENILRYLETEAQARPHLGEFFTAWHATTGGQYLPDVLC